MAVRVLSQRARISLETTSGCSPNRGRSRDNLPRLRDAASLPSAHSANSAKSAAAVFSPCERDLFAKTVAYERTPNGRRQITRSQRSEPIVATPPLAARRDLFLEPPSGSQRAPRQFPRKSGLVVREVVRGTGSSAQSALQSASCRLPSLRRDPRPKSAAPFTGHWRGAR